jgi:putative ABC transport system substrate-binding protein
VRRRDFITFIGGAAAWPLAAKAQEQGRVYRLGFLVPTDRQSPAIRAFFDELQLNGFIESQNLSVTFEGFQVRSDQIAEGAKAVVASKPDVIVAGPELYVQALQSATKTIPLVTMSEDLVGEGLVASLARPGGNVTGISLLSPELDDKRQGLLIEAIPEARKMAALVDANITPSNHLDALRAGAQARGVELFSLPVKNASEIEDKLAAAKSSGAQAINVLATPVFFINRQRIIARTLELRLPAIYQWPEMAEEGGLMGYGPTFVQVYRQRARQITKLLRGAKPSEVPIEQPTNFLLAVNLRTAKAIGHEIPANMVLRADQLIE